MKFIDIFYMFWVWLLREIKEESSNSSSNSINLTIGAPVGLLLKIDQLGYFSQALDNLLVEKVEAATAKRS